MKIMIKQQDFFLYKTLHYIRERAFPSSVVPDQTASDGTLIYTKNASVDYPKFIVPNQKDESISRPLV